MTIPAKSAVSVPPASANANAGTYSNLNGLAALKKNPNSPEALHAVAQQVDALFLQMMLKSMRDAGAQVGEADSNEMGMYQDMFDKQIALTLSQHQDLGLGAQLTRHLAAAAAASQDAPQSPAAASGALRTNLAIMGPSRGAAVSDGETADAASDSEQEAGAVDAPNAAGADPGAAANAAQNADPINPREFVSEVFPAIQRAAADAWASVRSAMLAQAALETGWGKRMPRTADGTPSLNMFGIKAGESWSGARAAGQTRWNSAAASPASGTQRFGPTARSKTASTTSRICSADLTALPRGGGSRRQRAGLHRGHRRVGLCDRSAICE